MVKRPQETRKVNTLYSSSPDHEFLVEHETQTENIDDADAVSLSGQVRRKRARHLSTAAQMREEVQKQKDELCRLYREKLYSQREKDKAWKWLSELNIPCHNMGIPVKPHTKAKAPAGSTEGYKVGELSELDVYEANTITPEVLAIYCDWRIHAKFKRPSKADYRNDRAVLRAARSEKTQFTHGTSETRPQYTVPPLYKPSSGEISGDIERYVWRTVRSAKSVFETVKLWIPLYWKNNPDPDYRSLPLIYRQLLAKADDYGGTLPEEGTEEFLDRALSQPVEELPASSSLLQHKAHRSVSPEGQVYLESLQSRFPIAGVTQKEALVNAKRARDEVNEANTPDEFLRLRREVAIKLSAKRFRDDVALVSAEDIKEAENCGLGSVLVQDTTPHADHQPANMIQSWVNKKRGKSSDTETGTEKSVGGLLNSIIVSEEVKVTNNGALKFPSFLQLAGVTPHPDVLSRAKVDKFPLLALFLPVLFAGECKKDGKDGPKTPAQLACALNATLVLLVLMFLDMREKVEDALPPWMFVYGILYTEKGVVIRAHFPTYKFKEGEDTISESEDEYILSNPIKGSVPEKTGKNKKKHASPKQDSVNQARPLAINSGRARWIFRSVEVYSGFRGAFQDLAENERLRLLAVLLIIQSHSFFLLKQFAAWANGAPATSAYAALKDIL